MNGRIIDSILAELTANIGDRSVGETDVDPAQVKALASDMSRRGYRPSASSLAALEAYCKGYGLWLDGGVGVGKTMFFRCLRPFPLKSGARPEIAILPMVRTIEMTVEEIREWLDFNRRNEVVLDDIGAEPVFNHFGGKFEILPYILDKRLDSPCRTHMTGNMDPRRVAERYGSRIIDRFAEMFTRVRFDGPSLRRPKPSANALLPSKTALRVAATAANAPNRNENGGRCAPRDPAVKVIGSGADAPCGQNRASYGDAGKPNQKEA